MNTNETEKPDARNPPSLNEMIDNFLRAPGEVASMTLPAPAAGQQIVYADRDGLVLVHTAGDDGFETTEYTPDEARALADLLYLAAARAEEVDLEYQQF